VPENICALVNPVTIIQNRFADISKIEPVIREIIPMPIAIDFASE
jgi:hypothetical protein